MLSAVPIASSTPLRGRMTTADSDATDAHRTTPRASLVCCDLVRVRVIGSFARTTLWSNIFTTGIHLTMSAAMMNSQLSSKASLRATAVVSPPLTPRVAFPAALGLLPGGGKLPPPDRGAGCSPLPNT